MTATQFLRLADRLQALPEGVRRTVELMAAGDTTGAEQSAGEKGSPDWWAAEFLLAQLADHGVTVTTSRRPAAAARQGGLFAEV